MSRSDDPSSRPVSKTNLKAVVPASVPREPRPRVPAAHAPGHAPKKKAEAKAEEKSRSVVQTYDSDFGVAMLIRGPDEA